MTAIDDKTRATALFISDVLFRACLLGFGLLLLTSLAVLALNYEIYALYNSVMEIPRAQYNTLLLAWLGDMKMLLFVFFLLPACAIRWVLRVRE